MPDLRDGPALTEWLAERGLPDLGRFRRGWRRRRLAEEDRRRLRSLQAAPAGLRDAAVDVSDPPGRDLEAWSGRLRDAKARLATLIQHGYPDGIERIRALLAWVGIPARESTGGLKWYDMAVQQQLLAEDHDLILAALTARPPSPGHLDGAAQLFGLPGLGPSARQAVARAAEVNADRPHRSRRHRSHEVPDAPRPLRCRVIGLTGRFWLSPREPFPDR